MTLGNQEGDRRGGRRKWGIKDGEKEESSLFMG